MNNEWIRGIVTPIRRNKGPLSLGNYRPVAPLNMIYVIWSRIVGNIPTPLKNLLTDEAQTEYTTNRSPLDVISLIGNEVKKQNKPTRPQRPLKTNR